MIEWTDTVALSEDGGCLLCFGVTPTRIVTLSKVGAFGLVEAIRIVFL